MKDRFAMKIYAACFNRDKAMGASTKTFAWFSAYYLIFVLFYSVHEPYMEDYVFLELIAWACFAFGYYVYALVCLQKPGPGDVLFNCPACSKAIRNRHVYELAAPFTCRYCHNEFDSVDKRR